MESVLFMKKKSENSKGLKKSTKITMFSCSGFVLITFLVLGFFTMYPITPNERMISNLGRENYSKNGQINELASPAVTTSADDEKSVQTTVRATEEAKSTTTRTDFEIVITTGSGFLWNARIPTASNPYTATVIAPNNYGDNQNYVDVEDYIAQNGGVTNTEVPGNEDPGASGGGAIVPDTSVSVPDSGSIDNNTEYTNPNAGGYIDPNSGYDYTTEYYGY